MSGALGGEVLARGDPKLLQSENLDGKGSGGICESCLISLLPSTCVVASQFLSCLLYAKVLCSTSCPLPFPQKLLSPRLPPESLSVISSLNQPLPLPLPLP